MAERMIGRGRLTYRERIALPPGSVAEVTLQDVSRADAPSTILARQTIPLEGRQVPVPFDLKVDRAQLQSGMRYSVRGVIRDSEGRMLWTTDTAHAVDTSASAVDLGLLLLVRAGSPEPVRSEEHTSELQSLIRISYAVLCLKQKQSTK